MKAEHINPFIIAVSKVMKDMCMIDLKIGKPSVRQQPYAADASIIKLGVVGNLQGVVLLCLEQPTALGVVSKMMMTPVSTIDAIGESAISELGNMVAGNAATVFANNNVLIDITPPTYYTGSTYQGDGNQMFSIPFSSDVGNLTVEVFIQE